MEDALSAHQYALTKVFSSDFDFKIPDYQRPYRWGVEQATQLLDDLEETYERGGKEAYFLGSLVLVDQGKPSYHVIDGQQRLTTLTILLALLRDLTTGSFSAKLAERVMEPGDEVDDIPARPRLELRAQETEFFRKYVQEPGNTETLVGLSDAALETEPQKSIRNNASAFRARLLEWDEVKLRGLAQMMSQRTYLVVVSTKDLDSAYRIFSVMNARGLDLTPADIFKSTVIGKIGDGPAYSKKWESAEETLGSDDFTELFRDLRTVISGVRARQELLQEFPKQVLDAYTENGRATEFVDDVLLPYGKAFERTIAADFGPGEEWEPVNQWLERLAMVDNKDWRPSALWALKEHADDAVYLDAFLCKLERLAAHFLLRQTYTTPRLARYLRLLEELKDGEGLDAPSFELSDEERRLALDALCGDIYRMQPRRARYVLLRLDELLAQKPGVTYNHKIISIEHVLPQNPKPGSQWRDDFTDQQRVELTHKLGNLVLLNHRKNSQANNYEFTTKRNKYFGTSGGSAVFALTTQVIKHSTWTPQVIQQRQDELTALLAEDWEFN